MDNRKGELANKDGSTAQKQEVLMLEVKSMANTNGVAEDLAEYRNVGDAAVHHLRDSRRTVRET